MSRSAIALAMTGASGTVYGLRLLRQFIASERTVYLMISDAARMVLETEDGLRLPARPSEVADELSARFDAAPGQLRVFGKQDWYAPVASGTGAPESMVICPCTTGTLAAVAHGASDNLMERAADVMLKERRRLILVVRETPFSEIHLENMLKLTRMGAIILPANPGFYHRPEGIEQLVDFIVARVLDQLGMEHDLMAPWGGTC